MKKFENISKLLRGKSAEDCAKRVRVLLKKLNMNYRLLDLGIICSDVEWMAENCMKVSAASIANNPVIFSREEIAQLYTDAL